ncbi:MAG: hypothetical protein KAU01_00755 [Candidatus Cloacimonetes bacterium]|nr:hypothetical protein [Candidatus Cloacimonadota bacterium]
MNFDILNIKIKEIEKIIKETEDLQTCVEQLYQLSQDNFSLDDVTIVLILK